MQRLLRGDPYVGSMARSAWLDVDWPAVTHRATVDGSEMTYVDIGEGPALVFVHGLGGSWQNWLENLPHFAAHAPLHRHGPRRLRRVRAGGRRRLDGALRPLGRRAHGARWASRRAGVVGNSMGGFIALELAIRRPDLVERLVLVSAAVLWQEYRHAKPLVTLANATEARRRARPGRGARAGCCGGPAPAPARCASAASARQLPRELQRELLLTGRSARRASCPPSRRWRPTRCATS